MGGLLGTYSFYEDTWLLNFWTITGLTG